MFNAERQGTIISTGCSGGLGSGFVKALLKTPYASIYHSVYTYDPSRPGTLPETLAAAPSHSHELIPLDLSLQSNIRSFAASINKRVAAGELPQVRALVLISGGIFNGDPNNGHHGQEFTADGLEKTFAVNYLSNFLLVLLLLPSMGPGARIIFICSTSHNTAFKSSQGIYLPERRKDLFRNLEDLVKGRDEITPGEEWISAMRRYGTSKLLMCMFIYELQRRLAAETRGKDSKNTLSTISSVAYDPGWVGGTALYSPLPWWLRICLVYIIVPFQIVMCYLFPNGMYRTGEKVGRDIVFACFDGKTLRLGMEPRALYLDGTVVGASSEESYDEGKWKRLWQESLRVVKIREGDTVLRNWR